MLSIAIELIHWIFTFFGLWIIGTFFADILLARFDRAIDEAFERLGL